MSVSGSAAILGLAKMLGLAVLVSLASAVAFVLAAGASSSVWWSAIIAAVTAVGLALGVAWLARRRYQRRAGVSADGRTPPVLARGAAGPAVLVLVTAVVSLSWLWPGLGRVAPDAVPGVTRISLPDGTQLAVHLTRAGTASREPLIVVHGGPGVADMAHDVPVFGLLASDRDVYVYDQIGTGASSRLSEPAGYTLSRAVADLEAVRAMSGTDRVVLLGHSWGASVAIAYLSQYPQRVAGLVLSAPGFLPAEDGVIPPGTPQTRLSGAQKAGLYVRLAAPRNLFAYAVTAANPHVAHAVAGDEEMDRRFAGLYARTAPALFCDPGLVDRLGTTGVGYYANQIPQLHPEDASRVIDLVKLRELGVPTLVIKPACDYIPWRATAAYRDVFPDAPIVLMPDAGHQAYLERPDAYVDLVSAFLAGRDLPLPAVTGTAVPEGYRGVR